jgi:hypothetical protein
MKQEEARENCMINVSFAPFAKHNWNNKFKKDEMDRARSPHWTEERAYQVLVGKPE